MMNKIAYYLPLLLCVCLLGSCKQDTEPDNFEPVVITLSADEVSRTDAVLNGTISESEHSIIQSCGILLSESSGMSEFSHWEVSTSELPSIRVTVSNLTKDKTYYYCAYAYSGRDMVKGNIKSFHTMGNTVPTLEKLQLTALEGTTFSLTCRVLDLGGLTSTMQGICYKQHTNGDDALPTIEDQTQLAALQDDVMSATVTGLYYDTEYWVRAFVANSVGIGYSDLLVIRTQAYIPPPTFFEQLYEETNGDNWTNNTNWLSDKPFGEWYGLKTDSNGDVTDIDLSNNNLKGDSAYIHLWRLEKIKSFRMDHSLIHDLAFFDEYLLDSISLDNVSDEHISLAQFRKAIINNCSLSTLMSTNHDSLYTTSSVTIKNLKISSWMATDYTDTVTIESSKVKGCQDLAIKQLNIINSECDFYSKSERYKCFYDNTEIRLVNATITDRSYSDTPITVTRTLRGSEWSTLFENASTRSVVPAAYLQEEENKWKEVMRERERMRKEWEKHRFD